MNTILSSPWLTLLLINNLCFWVFVWLNAYGQRRIRELYLNRTIDELKHIKGAN